MADPRIEPASRRLSHVPALLWRVLRIAYWRFCLGGTVLPAAAIAFFAIICVGPLGIVFAAALQAALGPGTEVYPRIEEAVNALGAETAVYVLPQVDAVLRNPEAPVAGAIGLLMLLWAGTRLFEAVERSLTVVWPGKLLRGFLGRKLVGLVMMLVAGVVLAAFMLFNTLFAAAQTRLAALPDGPGVVLAQALPRLLALYEFGAYFMAFALLYKFIPVQRVPLRVAAVGGLMAALLWQGASVLFSRFIAHSHQYGVIYGSLSGVVLFSLWAFLWAHVLLFGAHFAAAYERVFVRGAPAGEDDAFMGVPPRGPDVD